MGEQKKENVQVQEQDIHQLLKVRREKLADLQERGMDPFVITVEPTGETSRELVSHEGEEWLYGMEGCIEIEYGKDLYILHPGESIYYDSIVPHQVRAHNGQKAKFLACVYTPL